jgi:hypothetical protein
MVGGESSWFICVTGGNLTGGFVEKDFAESGDAILLAVGDSIELGYLPKIKRLDALLVVFGLAAPRHVFCEITLVKLPIYAGAPHAQFGIDMKDGSQLTNIKTPCGKAPAGWQCNLPRGHEGPCVMKRFTMFSNPDGRCPHGDNWDDCPDCRH